MEAFASTRETVMIDAGAVFAQSVSWSDVISDAEFSSHERNVADLAYRVALAAGLDATRAGRLRKAAAVHDIGKLSVPREILEKNGPLTPEEWALVKRHPLSGYQMLMAMGMDFKEAAMAAEIALCHHEAWDGSGYPLGLSGEQIPVEARIVAICDVYDALRSTRPYKKGMTHDEAVAVIAGGDSRTRPSMFCPSVLAAFLKVACTRGIDEFAA